MLSRVAVTFLTTWTCGVSIPTAAGARADAADAARVSDATDRNTNLAFIRAPFGAEEDRRPYSSSVSARVVPVGFADRCGKHWRGFQLRDSWRQGRRCGGTAGNCSPVTRALPEDYGPA